MKRLNLRHSFALTLLFALIVPILAACGGATTTPPAEAPTPAPAAPRKRAAKPAAPPPAPAKAAPAKKAAPAAKRRSNGEDRACGRQGFPCRLGA